MIKIDIDASKVIKDLTEIKNRIKNPEPIMAHISNKMKEAVDENFEQEGRPKWTALSPLTEKIREKKGYAGKPILQNSGDLKSKIEPNYGKDYALLSVNTKYAAIHQFGGTIYPKKAKALKVPNGEGGILLLKKVVIPARPYLQLTDEDIQEIREDIIDYLTSV